ncbi:MAG: hypothetical protein ACK5FE_03205, partial [Cyanobacteriota bacterium]
MSTKYAWQTVSYEDFENGSAGGWNVQTVLQLTGQGNYLAGVDVNAQPSRLVKSFAGLDPLKPTRMSADYIRDTSATTDKVTFLVNNSTWKEYSGSTWTSLNNPSRYSPLLPIATPGLDKIDFGAYSSMSAPGTWGLDNVKIEQRKVPRVQDFIDPSSALIYGEAGKELFIGRNFTLDRIKDYDGYIDGGAPASVKSQYKFQGNVDVNSDGITEMIFTNKSSGRFVVATPQFIADQVVDPITRKTMLQVKVDYADNGKDGGTRVAGIYNDPLVEEGEKYGGYLLSGQRAPVRGGPFDSQARFQNDLKIDNLKLRAAFDFDKDGITEVVWKTADNTAYLFSLMHDDGN